MSPRRPWSPASRRAELPRWSGAECEDCGHPVEVVILDVDPLLDPGTRIGIERTVIRTVPTPGLIAARTIGQQLHGHVITKLRPAAAGYSVFRAHRDVCSEAPPPPHEQHTLFDSEGNTTT